MKNFFEALNSYYWESIQGSNTLNDIDSYDSWIPSLIHFCNYAFERQGSPAVYRESAKETFRRNRKWLEKKEKWSDVIEIRLFHTFTEICRENYVENLNLKNNPMGPSTRDLISLIYFAWQEANNTSVTGWALNLIKNDNLQNAFNSLKKIRGVGDKISSFYLRDMYVLSGYHNRNIQNRHLLQPIDIWTRRAAKILSRDHHATDRKCAEVLITLEDELGMVTGASNIGFWVLGSQIAEDEKTFTNFVQCIRDRNKNRLRTLLNTKITEQRKWLKFLETIPID